MNLTTVLQHSTELWLALGVLGSILEAVGEWRGSPKLVALAQRMESLSLDLPKLWRGSRASAAASAEKAKAELSKPEEPKQ